MPTPPKDHSQPLFVGIDVGGTSIKLGLVSDSGIVLGSTSFSTDANHSPEVAVHETQMAIAALSRQLGVESEQIVAAGLGTPGPMDLRAGLILEPVNLPGWRHYPIRDHLSEAISLPVTFTNDANAAAYGEFWLGSAREYSSLVFFTLGTGVGGGIIIDDFCVEGAHSLGAELGHMRIDTQPNARTCSCGRPGHLEAYASATAVVSRTLEALKTRSSRLNDIRPLTAFAVFSAAEQGDELANAIIEETADFLAKGIDIVSNVIDPQAVLLGGAMTFGGHGSIVGRRFLERIVRQVKDSVFPEISQSMKIDFAQLGSEAGFIGAAGLARVQYRASQIRSTK